MLVCFYIAVVMVGASGVIVVMCSVKDALLMLFNPGDS